MGNSKNKTKCVINVREITLWMTLEMFIHIMMVRLLKFRSAKRKTLNIEKVLKFCQTPWVGHSIHQMHCYLRDKNYIIKQWLDVLTKVYQLRRLWLKSLSHNNLNRSARKQQSALLINQELKWTQTSITRTRYRKKLICLP